MTLSHSSGLFVGINIFQDSNDFPKNDFAVDDAIDLAHFFVIEQQRILSINTKLLISGEPEKDESKERLKTLKEKGVKTSETNHNNVLRSVHEICERTTENGFLVISISTHGFMQTDDYLLCYDSILKTLNRTSISIKNLLKIVSENTKAKQRVVLLDSCRESLDSSRSISTSRGLKETAMSEEVARTIEAAKGMAVFYSTTPGGYSYEDPKSRNGLFTGLILRGLKSDNNKLKDKNGCVTPEKLAPYLDEEIKKWVKENRPAHLNKSKGISYNADEASAMQIPLTNASDFTEPNEQHEKKYVFIHGNYESDENNDRVKEIIQKYIHPVCKKIGYVEENENETKFLLDASISLLHHAQMVIAYLGKYDWHSEILAKVGFRIATGKPIVCIHEDASKLPEALIAVLFEKGINIIDLKRHTDKTIKEKLTHEIIKNGASLFEGEKPEYPTAILKVDKSIHHADVRYIDADIETAKLLTGKADPYCIIGKQGIEIVKKTKQRVIPAQWEYLSREQNKLYHPKLDEKNLDCTVTPVARIPIVFKSEKGAADFMAIMPIVTNHSIKHKKHYYKIIHLNVTEWVSKFADGHYELAPSTGRDGMFHLHQLMNQVYYSPIPTLQVDGEKKILDMNLAMEILIGDKFEDIRNSDIQNLFDVLKKNAGNTIMGVTWDDPVHFEASKAKILEHSFEYQSQDFGTVSCHSKIAPLIDVEQGCPNGFVWYWTIDNVEQEHKYQEELKKAVNHALLWDVYSASYDRILPILPYYKVALERHVEAMKGKRNVIDVGAGTGNVTIQLLELEDGMQVTAIDSSRSMLNYLRSKLAGRFSNTLHIVQHSAEDLKQFEDSSFDGITAMMSIYDMVNKQAVINECIRVLQPGGTIIITDPKKGIKENYKILVRKVYDFLEEEGLKDELGVHLHRVEEAGKLLSTLASSEPCIKDIRQILEENKFEVLAFEDSHEGICATLTAKKAPI